MQAVGNSDSGDEKDAICASFLSVIYIARGSQVSNNTYHIQKTLDAIMIFSDLNCFVDVSCFRACPFYNQAVKQVAPAEIVAALDWIEMMDGVAARKDAVHRLQIAAEQAVESGWVRDESQLLPRQFETMTDVAYLLSRFERGERAAILFALCEGMSLNEVVHLKRRDLVNHHLSPEAAQVANRITPHLHSEWLFWHSKGGLPFPLSNLEQRWQEKMPMSWSMFCRTHAQRSAKRYSSLAS